MSEFKWTDSSVEDFVYTLTPYSPDEVLTRLAKFKASKQPKQEWEIVKMVDDEGFVHHLYPGCKEDPPCKIHSVRRLSDGEVFTVGDRVHNENYTELIDHWETRDGYPIACFKEQPPVSIYNLTKAPVITFENGYKEIPSERTWKVAEVSATNRITAVYRISDNKVFRIGQRVCIGNDPQTFEITGFSEGPKSCLVTFDDAGIQYIEDIDHPIPQKMPPAANGKVPVWLTPEQEGKLNRLLALFIDPMAGAVGNPKTS